MASDDRLGRRIKLQNLRVLQEAIAAGSMAKAARSLAMTQPAVSYAIGELEQALGVALLDRTPQGVLPTAYGEALAQRGVAIVNELRQALDDIAFLADPAAGRVRIGATPPMSLVAGAAIERLVRRHPRMSFHLVVEPTEILLRELRRRGIELIISRMADQIAPEGTTAEVLFYDRLAVLASKRNPWVRRRRPFTLRDLIDEPGVLPPPQGFLGPMITAAFAAAGVDAPRAAVTTASSYTLASLVAHGPFLAVHPETMLRVPSHKPFLTALPIELSGAKNPIGLLRLKDRMPSPVAPLFAKELRDVVRTLGLGGGRSSHRHTSPTAQR
jgi:LysR family pca operon transcriptional activator